MSIGHFIVLQRYTLIVCLYCKVNLCLVLMWLYTKTNWNSYSFCYTCRYVIYKEKVFDIRGNTKHDLTGLVDKRGVDNYNYYPDQIIEAMKRP